MLKELVQRITTENRRQLRVAGIQDSRVTEWQRGKGKPTYSQLKALAYVMGVNFCELANAVADETAPKETLEFFRRMEAQEGPQMKLGEDF